MKLIKYSLLLLCFNIWTSEESSNSQQNLPPVIVRLMSFMDLLKATEDDGIYEIEEKSIYNNIDHMITQKLNEKFRFYESCLKQHHEKTTQLDKEIEELYEQKQKCLISTENEPDGFGGTRIVQKLSNNYMCIKSEIGKKIVNTIGNMQ